MPRLPAWLTARHAQSSEDVAFLSGAALSHLQLVLGWDDVPQALLRNRMALRDAVHLLRPGDLSGPAGKTLLSWRKAVERSVSINTLHRALPEIEAVQIASWLDTGQGAPVTRAAKVLETVLTTAPRVEVPAPILADAALAQAHKWDHIVPLLASGLKRADLRKTGDELWREFHRAVTASVLETVRMACELVRKTTRLGAVAPKLRAKGAEVAVEMFLTCDAVAPSALTSLKSDRAARRFCDRLVKLGAVREVTGRDTFRLYGV